MTCESLSSLKLPETTITAAQSIPAGTYTAPDGQVFPNMPAFCRVAATLTPTSDSDIGIEVWMPASTWNGKFEGVGNGGFGGAISYSAMAPAVQLGYAATSTDTGHVGSSYDGSFALGHPQKIIDFGYRSIHLMTVRGKQISDAFYGENAQHSYFDGCSTGGRQALMEAQRFANDYDGIIAGDPVAYYTHHHVGGNLWVVRQMFNESGQYCFHYSRHASRQCRECRMRRPRRRSGWRAERSATVPLQSREAPVPGLEEASDLPYG